MNRLDTWRKLFAAEVIALAISGIAGYAEEMHTDAPSHAFSIIQTYEGNWHGKIHFEQPQKEDVELTYDCPWPAEFIISPREDWIIQIQKTGSGDNTGFLYRLDSAHRVWQMQKDLKTLCFEFLGRDSNFDENAFYHTGFEELSFDAKKGLLVMTLRGSSSKKSGEGFNECLQYDLKTGEVGEATSGPESDLQREFEKVDAALNDEYKKLTAELNQREVSLLKERQRQWIKYRDNTAEGKPFFNGQHPDDPKTTMDYWKTMTSLTQERKEFLAIYSGKNVAKGISGKYTDSLGGDLEISQKGDELKFSISVVRGARAHTGQMEGTAKLSGDQAVFRDDNGPCEVTFKFSDGHIVELKGKDTGEYGEKGVSFDGLYFKTD